MEEDISPSVADSSSFATTRSAMMPPTSSLATVTIRRANQSPSQTDTATATAASGSGGQASAGSSVVRGGGNGQ